MIKFSKVNCEVISFYFESIEDVYQMFRERFGCHFVYIPDQAGNYRRSIADPREAKDRLGWKVEDKLKDYILNL